MADVTIINYGMGNLRSIANALDFLGITHTTTSDAKAIVGANRLLLPGVGSYAKAMANIHQHNLFAPIQEYALQSQRPLLGICLGMQLMAKSSTEEGFSEGFGFFDFEVIRFDNERGLKVPNVGFNGIDMVGDSPIFEGVDNGSDFYFVHSYRVPFKENADVIATAHYGNKFVAAYQNANIIGTQFHPERSQSNGLQVLKNFKKL